MRRLGGIGRVWNHLACKREASRRKIAAPSPVLSCCGKAITLHSCDKMLPATDFSALVKIRMLLVSDC